MSTVHRVRLYSEQLCTYFEVATECEPALLWLGLWHDSADVARATKAPSSYALSLSALHARSIEVQQTTKVFLSPRRQNILILRLPNSATASEMWASMRP